MKILLFCVAVACFCSCSDILEEDIRNREIVLLAPGDSSRNELKTQGFWWEDDEEIENYRIQIVEGSFARPNRIVKDTLIKTNKFNSDLLPNKYQWRVRGENFAYETAYSKEYMLYVDSTYDLSSTIISLISPANASTVVDGNVRFEWERVNGATGYFIKIDSYDGKTQINKNVSGTFIRETLPEKETKYDWTVKAIYDSDGKYSESPFALSYEFTVDTSATNQ